MGNALGSAAHSRSRQTQARGDPERAKPQNSRSCVGLLNLTGVHTEYSIAGCQNLGCPTKTVNGPYTAKKTWNNVVTTYRKDVAVQ